MSTPVDRRQLLELRLASQLIQGDGTGPSSVAGVVHHLLAMQAQNFGQALWAVGLRSPGATRRDVLSALDRGDVVRSWPMRGTLFVTGAADLRWMLDLTAERTLASFAGRRRQLELDAATLDGARGIAQRVLSGHRRQGRTEFLRALEEGGISTDGQRGYHIIWYLAQTGTVCWGPPQGTEQALVLLDEWVPDSHRLERDQALSEFVFRYFAGHGPATLRDFAWWSKLTVADTKRGLELARDRLTELTYDGGSYWVATSTLDRRAGGGGTALLPAFDEYIVGYQDRTGPLAPEYAHHVIPGKNGIFRPTIVSGGRVTGTWRRAKPRSGSPVVAEPFVQFTDRQQKVFARLAQKYGTFWNGTD